jgi:gas vesicle structural protein
MTVATQTQRNRYLERPAPSSLADVIDTILDKGLVIDIYVRVSLVGIELLTIDARIVVASVDTYLRFAEAVNRLDLQETQVGGIPELVEDMTERGAKGKTSGAIEAAKEKVSDFLEDEDEEAEEEEKEPSPRTRKKSQSRSSSTKSRRSSGTRRSSGSKG